MTDDAQLTKAPVRSDDEGSSFVLTGLPNKDPKVVRDCIDLFLAGQSSKVVSYTVGEDCYGQPSVTVNVASFRDLVSCIRKPVQYREVYTIDIDYRPSRKVFAVQDVCIDGDGCTRLNLRKLFVNGEAALAYVKSKLAILNHGPRKTDFPPDCPEAIRQFLTKGYHVGSGEELRNIDGRGIVGYVIDFMPVDSSVPV